MSDSEQALEDAVHQNPDETQDQPDGGKKKRRRRRRKKSTDGAAAESTQNDAGDAANDDAGNDDAGDGEAKPRKRRRRRGGKGRKRKGDDGGGQEPSADDRPGRDDESDDRAKPDDRSHSEPVDFPDDDEYDAEVFSDKKFTELGIRNSVLKGARASGFTRPTHIQAELIPVALTGKDILGQAKTGTGKTAAFAMPILHNAEKGKAFQSIILCPTRELAIQISAEITALGEYTPIKNTAVYGGQPIPIQKKKLEQGPEIIVATPGRLMDMHQHRNIHFDNVHTVVLDEVDRMLDIGFRDDIKRILKSIRTDHQTVFVSATISDEIEKLARTFMDDPERLTLTAGALTVQMVDQHYISCEFWYKRRLLLHMLTHEDPALTVVFCRTKATVDRVAKFLRDKNIDARAIHGDMPQAKRNAVMRQMRGGKLAVLVASDLAARGLDVEGVTHVINYDVPEDPEIYVHRIGRTARAGKRGEAWSLVGADQGELLTEIEKLTNVQVDEVEYPDFDPGEPPAKIRQEIEAKEKRMAEAEKQNRLAAPDLPDPRRAKQDDDRFPGGLVPTKLPPRMMGGKVRTTRGMRQMENKKPFEEREAEN